MFMALIYIYIYTFFCMYNEKSIRSLSFFICIYCAVPLLLSKILFVPVEVLYGHRQFIVYMHIHNRPVFILSAIERVNNICDGVYIYSLVQIAKRLVSPLVWCCYSFYLFDAIVLWRQQQQVIILLYKFALYEYVCGVVEPSHHISHDSAQAAKVRCLFILYSSLFYSVLYNSIGLNGCI